MTGDDLNEYLDSFARACKLAAIREFYRSMENSGLIDNSPVDAVDTPKRERKPRT